MSHVDPFHIVANTTRRQADLIAKAAEKQADSGVRTKLLSAVDQLNALADAAAQLDRASLPKLVR